MKRTAFKYTPKPKNPRKQMRRKSKKRVAYEASPAGLEDLRQEAMRRQLPCVVCDAYGMMQMSPTTCHHWIMGRVGTRRTPSNQSLPLCDGHHQGNFDKSKIAIHREPDAWEAAYGKDTDYIQITQDKIEQLEALNA